MPRFPVDWSNFGLAIAISTARPAQMDLQHKGPTLYSEMAPLPVFNQVFKMWVFSDRYLFMGEKAGQRPEAYV